MLGVLADSVQQIIAQKPKNNVGNDSGGNWNLEDFFNNATDYMAIVGGSFLALLGICGVVWGGALLIKKLTSEQSRESWLKIVGLIVLGGSFIAAGTTLILRFARGGADTIDRFGNGGFILDPSIVRDQAQLFVVQAADWFKLL